MKIMKEREVVCIMSKEEVMEITPVRALPLLLLATMEIGIILNEKCLSCEIIEKAAAL
jgi:hypothetical protein